MKPVVATRDVKSTVRYIRLPITFSPNKKPFIFTVDSIPDTTNFVVNLGISTVSHTYVGSGSSSGGSSSASGSIPIALSAISAALSCGSIGIPLGPTGIL